MNMETERKSAHASSDVIGRKSWLAYLGSFIGFLFFAISVPGSIYLGTENTLWSLIGLSVVAITYLYVVLYLKSYKLYVNQKGVWIDSGVLPWESGAHGVKWQDLNEASYKTGFVSWITNSYKICISHRYTKTSEIFLTNIWAGKKAVLKINRIHSDMLSNSREIIGDTL